MSAIPLQRSKAFLEANDWKVWKVEVWNQWSRRKTDLYNLMDLVAIKPKVKGVLGVQCCSEDVNKHIEKYLKGWTDPTSGRTWGPNEYLSIWKESGNRMVIHSWVKRGARGERKLWVMREIEL